MKSLEWEQVDNFTMRARVHDGWLVKHYEQIMHLSGDEQVCEGTEMQFSICFVRDKLSVWQITGLDS